MMRSETLRVLVLVSVGCHPVSGRTCRASLDAQALELALGTPGSQVGVVHVGDPAEPALREYLGMGPVQLTVLSSVEPASDVLSLLVSYIRQHAPDLVLCGERAEWGEASGLVPYLLAEQLGYPLLPHIVALEAQADEETDELKLTQALPRGQRRQLAVATPAVLTVSSAAPAARQSAFIRARDGEIHSLALDGEPTAIEGGLKQGSEREAARWPQRQARKRPKPLKVHRGKTAAERMKAAIAVTAQQEGQVLEGVEPEQAAATILALLRQKGLVK
ncbi:electron transfer flavoprotein subunit beta [Photobacterium atrarenae]|uniref:Electron transfer flavoprotein subunit beta n=1 Tax=Photobacterium atrarenae TaxID=865757 RepID=A0ABY5GL59_9GAMM|nr:electron transfer flavoprotein subunit beta [Photobacterium atrarenae]UTV29516.1 electron transfer flavoprotein subunit beta [Photobacterium atrarenae]